MFNPMSVVVSSLLCLIAIPTVLSASFNSVVSLDATILLKWTTSALNFFEFHRCVQVSLADNEECYRLSQIRRQQVAVHVGRAATSEDESTFYYQMAGKANGEAGRKKVYAILPDSANAKESLPHDAILALDPYPNYNFGHFIGLFYVDFGVDESSCQQNHQVLTADNACITAARKSRCPNLLDHRTVSYLPRRCHIDFLPTVYLAGLNHAISPTAGSLTDGYFPTDLLECIRLPGFASCPKLRAIEETEKILCDSTHINSKRCDTSYSGVGSRCRIFQSCDRAVLVGGGWNRMHSGTHSLLNIYKMREMLLRNGFHGENIKAFYGNGGQPIGGGASGETLSSAMKTGLRGHLRLICETRHCADTLFVYLNNPTTAEGNMLLWDVDSDGLMNELEVYTPREFLADISHCLANRVVLVIEQSNSEILLESLKGSRTFPNVIAFAGGISGQLTINGEISDIWANHSHPTHCLQQLLDTCKRKIRNSIAVVHDYTLEGSLNKISIIGAPCDINPPLTQRELHSYYQGCQNIPTSLWFSLNDGGSTADRDEFNGEYTYTDENAFQNRRVQ